MRGPWERTTVGSVVTTWRDKKEDLRCIDTMWRSGSKRDPWPIMLLELGGVCLGNYNHCWVANKEWCCYHGHSRHTTDPASMGTGRNSHQSKLASVCWNFLLISVTIDTRMESHQSKYTCPSFSHLIHPQNEGATVPWSAAAFVSSHLGREQMPGVAHT